MGREGAKFEKFYHIAFWFGNFLKLILPKKYHIFLADQNFNQS